MNFDQALNNARGIGVLSPEAIERETVRSANSRAPRCSAGHPTTYNHGVGAFRCEWGALVRSGGTVVRSCEVK